MKNINNKKQHANFKSKLARTRSFMKNSNKQRVYSYIIYTPLISYTTPDYTEQNLRFGLYNLLLNNATFTKLAQIYQQVKLNSVAFCAIPRHISGTSPNQIWIYLDTEGNPNFNYTNMPELQGSRLLPLTKNSITRYSTTGRQNDFHVWRDINNLQNPVGLSIRLRSEQAPSNQRYWQFQIKYTLKFRGMKVPVAETTRENIVAGVIEEKVNNIKDNEPTEYDYEDEEEDLKGWD